MNADDETFLVVASVNRVRSPTFAGGKRIAVVAQNEILFNIETTDTSP